HGMVTPLHWSCWQRCTAESTKVATSRDEKRWHRPLAPRRAATFFCQCSLRRLQKPCTHSIASRPSRSEHVIDSLPRSDEAKGRSSVLDNRSTTSREQHCTYGIDFRSTRAIGVKQTRLRAKKDRALSVEAETQRSLCEKESRHSEKRSNLRKQWASYGA